MTLEESIAALHAELREVRAELRQVLEQRSADRYLNVRDAAKRAEVHVDTIRAWINAGELPRHHAGRELRVKISELERFMADRRTSRPSVEEEARAAMARVRR